MKTAAYRLIRFARRASRLPHAGLLPAAFAGILLFQIQSAEAALSFARGTPTAVGPIGFSSTPDAVIITGAFTGAGTISGGLNIPAKRIQYDIINSDQGPMYSWTLRYSPAVGPAIIGVDTALGYVTSAGTDFLQGGQAWMTLFNFGYGVYNYNTGAPWIIDYQPDHITFTGVAGPPPGLPANDGVGYLNPTLDLTSFAIQFDPNLNVGLVPASANVGTAVFNGQVYGPIEGNPPTNCISLSTANIVTNTCDSCVSVLYGAYAYDTCCTNGPVTISYNPPPGTCFAVNTTTTVNVTATDDCGNVATGSFTVQVVPGANCNPTNCITLHTANIVTNTCNSCVTVPYNAWATDTCCPNSAVKISYNPPEGTCFAVNTTTTVNVTATDDCGNVANGSFTVQVVPGANCNPTNCISLYTANIVTNTCDNCVSVLYNVHAFDSCCPGAIKLTYNPPEGTCFPRGTTTTVNVTATDDCGNVATGSFTVQVVSGPNCEPTNCISLFTSNIVTNTCNSCVSVPYTAWATDPCCATGATLTYNPPPGTCFPVGTTTTVNVTASDACGNIATGSFTVTVALDPNCDPAGGCISLYASNIVVSACTNCVTVPYNAFAFDSCCTNSPVTLTYNPPPGTCFPPKSTTPVQVIASDACGNSATRWFTVTVLPAAGCGGGSSPLSISALTGPSIGGTNYITVWWPGTGVHLEGSSDLLRWDPIPGATNSPYVAPKEGSSKFFRLNPK